MTAFFFVDADGTENISNEAPRRHQTEAFWVCEHKKGNVTYDALTELPKGTIKTLFNIDLTWNDAPIIIEYSKNTLAKEKLPKKKTTPLLGTYLSIQQEEKEKNRKTI